MSKFISTHAKSSTTGVGFAKWPFALIFSVGFSLLSISFIWATVRLIVAEKRNKNKEAEQ